MADTTPSRWWCIGAPLMTGLFVAYLDRTNLSVGLPSVARDLGFAGNHFAVTSSWVLTIFLIGYALANVAGGIVTRRLDPKAVVIWSFAIWSLATVIAGLTTSVAALLVCRLILGAAEGVYWPQMSRFARSWFAPAELTKANTLIQYYGQYLALATGFLVLTPIYEAFGWRTMFYLTGGLGLVFIVPMYLKLLRPQSEAPFYDARSVRNSTTQMQRRPLTFDALGGGAFVLLVISYITQGMLFWGITLWIPLAVKSLGFSGIGQALASALPFAAAVLLAIPMSMLSDRTNRRVLIASVGLLVAGVLLLMLPQIDNATLKLAVITIALGFYSSSYTPNIWSILQLTVRADAIGPASGIMNGVGAGGGGTIAGFLVGLLYHATGSYMPGFTVLGALVVLGGFALLASGWVSKRRRVATALQHGV